MTDRALALVPLDDLIPNPVNPKAHADDLMQTSLDEFGYIEPVVIDARTGLLISGHGRRERLQAMRDSGAPPPTGVTETEDGTWLVPAVTGWASRDDDHASAALVALNRIGEKGGWDEEALIALLTPLDDTDLILLTGFDHDDLTILTGTADLYTRKADPIQYTPTSDQPPPLPALVDRAKMLDLVQQIGAADLPADVAEFLVTAAQRHNVFDYAQIAEYYVHAPAEVQALMEASALVIVDYDDAIRHGFVALSERLTEIRDKDVAEKAARDA